MKDTSRPRPNPSFRPTPYRKRKSSATTPARGTRRQYDTSRSLGHISPRSPDRAQGSRHDGVRAARPNPPADERRFLNRTVSHTRARTNTNGNGAKREWPSHTGVPSTPTVTDVPDMFQRDFPASTPPTTTTFNGRGKSESPPPGSVTEFLRSVELLDKPSSSAHPLQTSFPDTPPSFGPPSLLKDNANKIAYTNGIGHQVSLVYKGYPFTYDLSALPDDPKGTIALLAITQSDPGAYILVGAHYRRTGRSRAACTVIRSLLDTLDIPTDVERPKEDASLPTSGTSTMTLVSPDSPSSYFKTVDLPTPMIKRTAMRPAMLLLAACELDISRERPDDPQSATHASTAHDLFRIVYGTVSDAIVAGAARSEPRNALGLEFSDMENGLPFSLPSDSLLRDTYANVESLARVKDLEKELGDAHVAEKTLREELLVTNGRLICAEDKIYALESRSHEVLAQRDALRDESWELRQRLAESERRATELAQCAPSSESRVWGKLKDLLFDNLGGGVRGE